MTDKNLGDVYFEAFTEIARLTASVESRKTSMNLVHGNEMMIRIRKIIATVEEEEDRFTSTRSAEFAVYRDAIIYIHNRVASKDDDLIALEEVLQTYADKSSREAWSVDLLEPNMKMASPAGLRQIIKTCQYALEEHLRRAIGVE